MGNIKKEDNQKTMFSKGITVLQFDINAKKLKFILFDNIIYDFNIVDFFPDFFVMCFSHCRRCSSGRALFHTVESPDLEPITPRSRPPFLSREQPLELEVPCPALPLMPLVHYPMSPVGRLVRCPMSM